MLGDESWGSCRRPVSLLGIKWLALFAAGRFYFRGISGFFHGFLPGGFGMIDRVILVAGT